MKRRRRISMPLRRPRWATVVIGFILVLLLLIVLIWTQRRQIATDYIERELERRGVEATYKVSRIGFRTQQLEDLVIGDPLRPDLTAEFVEVKISWGLRRPKIGMITARGVRLFGRLVDEKITFGDIDKLLPPPSGRPFTLPDIKVDVADTAIALQTPSGLIAAAIEGRGNLADGFRGEMAVRSRRLLLDKCVLDSPVGYARIAIDDREPTIDGPIRAERLTCPTSQVDLANPVLDLEATVSETLNRWRGNAGISVQRADLGTQGAAGVTGRISFNGSRKLTRGAMDLTAVQGRIGGFTSARTNLAGRYALSLGSGDISMLADLSATGISGGGDAVGPIIEALNSAGGTPLEPIGEALAAAVRRAANGFDATASLRLINTKHYGAVRVEELAAESRSGARFGLNGGEGITYYWPTEAVRIDGEFGLTGGGFPAMRVSLNQPRGGAPMRGEARIAPYTVGNARLALARIRFRAGSGGATRIETAAVVSGPIGEGAYVRNLALPVAGTIGNGGFAFGEGCVTASFDSLRVSSLTLGRTRLPLCPTGRALIWKNPGGSVQGGARLPTLNLTGRLGSSPLRLTGRNVRFNLADNSFSGSNVTIRLGQSGYVNQLDLDRLTGRITDSGVAGTFAGAEGAIANVPLDISDARGEWRLVGGDLSLNGSLTVSDQADPPRFWPLVSNDFELTLRDNEIDARGWLIDPETGTRVTEAVIRHSLNTGSGNAVLDVPGIAFAVGGYQPEELTRLTTGVVALVDGTLVGRGEIRWSDGGTTSTGTFSTADMDLAAPFGPVEGLTTTINFTDLLGLTSAPGQVAQVDLIRTGIDVVDGTIRYQLLPNSNVRVESGVWPFMGGELRLRETVLDFSQPSTKRLTFDVIGLDAAVFVQEMEFANIEATGIFDGVLPMEFDQTGGRIVNGRLEARPPGGTLSYVGVVTEADLGSYGLLAFNALKSLRYDRFVIGLDGSLEGEFLAAIELDGIATNTAPQGGIAGYIIGQIAKIPFEFNINIRGPFRALIATARSFEDPGQIIQPVLPPELQDLPIEVIEQDKDEEETVQPQESETVQ